MKNITLYLSPILLAIVITSCCKAIFEEHVFINNQTSETITISAYQDGKSLGLILSPNTNQEIDERTTLVGKDSVIVKIGNRLTEKHYNPKVKVYQSNTDSIAYSSSKNIINQNNFQREIVERLACDGAVSHLTYSFK